MLAPNDLDPIIGALNGFHANVRAADSLSAMFKSLTMYPVPNEADWVKQLRRQQPNLSRNGDLWETGKITIVPNALSPLVNYYNNFSAVAAILPEVDDGQIAAGILTQLITPIEGYVVKATQAKNTFTDWVSSARIYSEELDECVARAWRAIGASEYKIAALSERIGQIQIELSELDGVISLNSISTGSTGQAKDIFAQMATMFYSVALRGGTLPVMGVAVSFFTLGKMFYDIFSTAQKTKNKINDLKNHRLDLSFEHLSLAQTKSALQFVYQMKESLARQGNTLREIEAFWQNEQRNLMLVRTEFANSTEYKKDNPSVAQLPIALSVWHTLRGRGNDLLKGLNGATDAKAKIDFAL